MNPGEDEAVREAQRRRAGVEAAALLAMEEEMRLQAVRRARRYWIWMGLMPGLLAVPVWWIIMVLGDRWTRQWENVLMLVHLGMAFWVGYCSLRLVKTRREVSVPVGIVLSIGLFVLFGIVNAAIFWVLFLASCVAVAVFNGR